MPLLGSIPLPGGFTEGLKGGQSIYDSMMENQYKKALAEHQQREDERLSKMAPYEIYLKQMQAEEARTNMNILKDFLGGGNGGSQYSPMENIPQPGFNAIPSPGKQNFPVSQPGQPLRFGESDQVGSSPINAPNSPYKNMVAAGMINQGQQQQIPGMDQQQPMPQQQSPGMAQPQQMPQQPQLNGEAQSPQGIGGQGKESIIRPGDPNKYKYDKLAGMTIGKVKIPDRKTRLVDGIEYTRYPSGKETMAKVGPSYEEKQQVLLDNVGKKKAAELNATESVKTEQATKELLKSAEYINHLHDLITESPHMTSAWYGVPYIGERAARGSSNKNLGTFISTAAALQAQYAKIDSSRGGIGMVNFYGQTKPDYKNSPQINQGMIEANAQKVLDQFHDQKADWESRNPGKEFPYKEPDFSNILNPKITIIAPDGKEHVIRKNNLAAAIAKHPGTRLKGDG